jgi:hypothetical protein
MAESMSAKRTKSIGTRFRDFRRCPAFGLWLPHAPQGSSSQTATACAADFLTSQFYNNRLTQFDNSSILEVFGQTPPHERIPMLVRRFLFAMLLSKFSKCLVI